MQPKQLSQAVMFNKLQKPAGQHKKSMSHTQGFLTLSGKQHASLMLPTGHTVDKKKHSLPKVQEEEHHSNPSSKSFPTDELKKMQQSVSHQILNKQMPIAEKPQNNSFSNLQQALNLQAKDSLKVQLKKQIVR